MGLDRVTKYRAFSIAAAICALSFVAVPTESKAEESWKGCYVGAAGGSGFSNTRGAYDSREVVTRTTGPTDLGGADPQGGLFGGLHCVGMCGPIAMTLFSQGKNKRQWPGILLYNSGRIMSYALLGGIMGLIGAAAVMFNAARFVSLVLGMVMIVLSST